MSEQYIMGASPTDVDVNNPDDAARLAIEGNNAPQDEPQQRLDGQPDETQAEQLANEAGLDIGLMETHWLEHGTIPETEVEKLAKFGISKQDAEGYIAYLQAQAEQTNTSFAEEVGGEEVLSQMQVWAVQSWDDAQLAAYNKAVDSGDAGQIRLALKALKAEYSAANPSRPAKPKLISAPNVGKAGQIQPYQSLAEAQRDYQNPRYHSDPAFRAQVSRRAAMSRL